MKTTRHGQFWKEFAEDESGQSTTEYILILALVVMIANQFRGQFKKIMDKMIGGLETQLNEAIDETGG